MPLLLQMPRQSGSFSETDALWSHLSNRATVLIEQRNSNRDEIIIILLLLLSAGAGIEPATNALTVHRSTSELPSKVPGI